MGCCRFTVALAKYNCSAPSPMTVGYHATGNCPASGVFNPSVCTGDGFECDVVYSGTAVPTCLLNNQKFILSGCFGMYTVANALVAIGICHLLVSFFLQPLALFSANKCTAPPNVDKPYQLTSCLGSQTASSCKVSCRPGFHGVAKAACYANASSFNFSGCFRTTLTVENNNENAVSVVFFVLLQYMVYHTAQLN